MLDKTILAFRLHTIAGRTIECADSVMILTLLIYIKLLSEAMISREKYKTYIETTKSLSNKLGQSYTLPSLFWANAAS